MKDINILTEKVPLDATIVGVLVLLWSLPLILAYLFIRLCIVKPIYSLFGGKKK